MARQVIDTTTNNGSYIGDPAKTAFEKTNANFAEIYNWGGGGALAKLTGGNIFTGAQIVEGNVTTRGASGAFWLQDRAGNRDYVWYSQDNVLRLGTGLRGAATSDVVLVDSAGTITANGNVIGKTSVFSGQNFESITANLVLATGTAGAIYFRPRGSSSAQGQFIAYESGILATWDGIIAGGSSTINGNLTVNGQATAVSFNPTSSADVKDYIEGYAGDACAELDRLAVITYRYREGFAGPSGVVAGLLAENVHAIWPTAVGGDYDEVVQEPVLLPDGSQQIDEQGAPVTVAVTRHVPMNIDMMQVLARTVRAHQQKSRRIKILEDQLASVLSRLESAGI